MELTFSHSLPWVPWENRKQQTGAEGCGAQFFKKGGACIIYILNLSVQKSCYPFANHFSCYAFLESGRDMKFKIAQFDQEKKNLPRSQEGHEQ